MISLDPTRLRSVDWDDGIIVAIDQTVLPGVLTHLRLADADQLIEAIGSLRIRGAPAIGIAGAFGVALCAHRATIARSSDRAIALTTADALRIRAARPTAANLAWAVDRVLGRLGAAASSGATPAELAQVALLEAFQIRAEDQDACAHMAKHAQAFFKPGARVLTHCNTGLLCTGGIGTALGAIRIAHEDGLGVRVLASETRPLLQGARLTAWELGILGIPYELIVDAAGAGLILGGEVDLVIVGADRIAANGDVANKVGTLGHALAAREARIPFVVVAPRSTIDPSIPSGAQIQIEERDPIEVTRAFGAEVAGHARNPAFDVTPARFITAIVTEDGISRPPFNF